MTFSSEIEQLLANLRERGRLVVDLLIPGIDSARVIDRLGLGVPDSVIEWFAWCNGVHTERGQIQDEISVIPGYYPLSLDEALSYVDDYAEFFGGARH